MPAATRQRVILHIGYPKTGTSSIQHYVHNHADDLRSLGVLWPRSGRIGYANHRALALVRMHEEGAIALPHRFTRRNYKGSGQQLWEELVEEITASQCHTAIVSTELFIHLAEDDTTRVIIDEIAGWLADFDVTVVAYVRRNDDHLEAMYNQRIKSGERLLPLEDTLDEGFRRIHLDYAASLGAWADRFGDENTRVRVFSPDRLEAGDAVTDFMTTIGMRDFVRRHAAVEDSNQRLPNHLLDLKRIVNHLDGHRSTRSTVNELLRSMGAARPVPSGRLLSPEARAQIMERSAEANAEVARRFLGTEEPMFRLDPEPAPRVEPSFEDRLDLLLGLHLQQATSDRQALAAIDKRLERIEKTLASTAVPPAAAPPPATERARRQARVLAKRVLRRSP